MKNLFSMLAVLMAGSPAVAQSPFSPTPSGHSAAAPVSAPQAPVASADMARAYGRLPLQFEPNVGQMDKQVRFVTHTSGGTLFLTDREAVLTLPCRDAKSAPVSKPFDPHARLGREKPAPTRYSVLRMKLTGAVKPLATSGMDKLPGIVNYFRGKDPKQWHTNIPTYRKARFAGVYKGVDMVYYGAQDGRLEYDFVVKPGADPRQIRLAFSGAKAMRVTENGDLALQTPAGEVLWHRPVTYQLVDGKRQTVACNYQLEHEAGTPTARFALARYDANKPLVIDPTLEYSTYLGGSGYYDTSNGSGIAVDSSGSVYVTGNADASYFPVSYSAFQTTTTTFTCPFVTKFNAAGSALIYSTYLGGSNQDAGNSIAVDGSGNAYVTGKSYSSDFPVTRGAFQTTYRNAFVTKLNARGSALVYSTTLYGAINAIAIDGIGNAYLTGYTYAGSRLPTTPGAFQLQSNNKNRDVFVTKLNASGSALVYSTLLSGSGSYGDVGNGITVDSSGNACVVGQTSSADFPVTPNAFQTTNKAKDSNEAMRSSQSLTPAAPLSSIPLTWAATAKVQPMAVTRLGLR